jgi:hypothetical protein
VTTSRGVELEEWFSDERDGYFNLYGSGYQATRLWHRFRPTGVAFVLRKPG